MREAEAPSRPSVPPYASNEMPAEHDRKFVIERSRELINSSHELRKRALVLGAAYRTPEETASATVEAALLTLGARGGIAFRMRDDTGVLEPLGMLGVPAAVVNLHRALTPSSEHPATLLLRHPEAHLYGREELRARFPAYAAMLRSFGIEAVALAPILRLDELDGFIEVFFGAEGPAPGNPLSTLRAIAARLGRSLVHARMYFAEREAREGMARAWKSARTERDAAEAARKAEMAANVAKDEFIAVMSHELRTPLSAILGYSELLVDGMAGELTERQRDLVRRLHEGGRQLLELIEALLGVSRLRAGRELLAVEPFDLSDVFRRAMDVTTPLADRRGLSLSLTLPPNAVTMTSDPLKVLQIVVNLIGNAVKYTNSGGVDVRVRVEREGNGGAAASHVVIVVRDTGIGIGPDELTRIFDPFWQGDRRLVRTRGGAGLGLAIVRGFTDLLGGAVDVESEQGVGSTFTVRLPVYIEAR